MKKFLADPAAMETYQQRLQRFQNNSPIEFIATILHSISVFYIPELKIAADNKQSNLLILGLHSAIETISENIFLEKGVKGFKFYLENFVDTDEDGGRFSQIADELNAWRNIIAHQWISKFGHSLVYDYSISTGYKIENGIIILNPKTFFKQFQSAFSENNNKTKRKIWDYRKMITIDKMKKAKAKFLSKFKNR